MISTPLPPTKELVSIINAQLGGVEEVIDLGIKYQDARIVQVRSTYKHPDADKLTVCLIDDGGTTGDAWRNEEGLIQVVCGAPNVEIGMWAVWLPPESVVPATYGDAEPFKLEARKLRGVMSYGMLAAGDELGINDDHAGIISIHPNDLASPRELQPGELFSIAFELDDEIIEIENKMFTHRPDCFGQIGVAREIAAIVQQTTQQEDMSYSGFQAPEWYSLRDHLSEASDSLELEVFNETDTASPRFMAVAISDVTVEPSPLWLQCRLVTLGSRPVNNVVDLTNYSMLMSAQPTHAYDYDKLEGRCLGVRMARQGESITLINGKTYELDTEDVVIADVKKAVGLAGVMGGLESEVTVKTRNIVLEVANFDMYAIRKTSMRHGLFTDAVTRFNKGQSIAQSVPVLRHLLAELPGVQASEVYDLPVQQSAPTGQVKSVEICASFVNARLGSDFTIQKIATILRSVEWSVTIDDRGESAQVSVPFWRTDIQDPEDVVEEVGRLYGFDELPRQLPTRTIKIPVKNVNRQHKQKIRSSLAKSGANELLTYSFVHQNVLMKAAQDQQYAFKLSNALSPDLQFYRLSVLPSLLEKVYMNVRAGEEEFALFEIGKGHHTECRLPQEGQLPAELEFIDLVYASKRAQDGSPYYKAQAFVRQLAHDLGVRVSFEALEADLEYQPQSAPFELSRSARVRVGDQIWGIIGELKASVQRDFKLPEYTAAASLQIAPLAKVDSSRVSRYQPLSRYPSVGRDVCFQVGQAVSYASIQMAIESVVSTALSVVVRADLVDIYQESPESETKNCTFHFTLTPYDRTLEGDEAGKIIDQITQVVCEKTAAKIV